MNENSTHEHPAARISETPVITEMSIIPVAGYDSMLLNLSGAHAPFFTRNVVILTDSAGHTGVGEVPGGERIRQTLEDARSLVVGQCIGRYNNILNTVRKAYADRDAAGEGCKPSICALPSMRLRHWRRHFWICWGNSLASRSPLCSGKGSRETK